MPSVISFLEGLQLDYKHIFEVLCNKLYVHLISVIHTVTMGQMTVHKLLTDSNCT